MEIKGFDLSSYKKGMRLSNDIGFCILRAGFTGWGGDGTGKYKDECFEDFYSQCKSLGIPVGAYWFSCANNYNKGKAEAEFMYENCLKGKQFEYPIYIDVEDSHHQVGNKRGVTDAIIGFCETLENLGYYVGVYGSDIATFQEKVYLDELKAYDKWVARYGSRPKYVKDYQMWQYSENGNYKGYNDVDLDYSYLDYPKLIKSKGFNGFPKQNNIKPKPIEKKLEIGTRVKTISTGNGASDGSSNRARSDLIGKITRIKEGAKYPYLVEDYGWYQKDALEII